MISKIEILPPSLPQKFDSLLLSNPYTKFGDNLETFDRMWIKVLRRWANLEKNPTNKKKCEQIKLEIERLYERAKIKEKEREGQASHKTQRFMYSVFLPEGMARKVCSRLVLGCDFYRDRKHYNRTYHALHKAKIKKLSRKQDENES